LTIYVSVLICRAESESTTQENNQKIFITNDLLEEKQLEVLEWEYGLEFIDKVKYYVVCTPLKILENT
jgi:hypothetical protein